MAPTPGVIGRKAVSAADKSAMAAAPAAGATSATHAAAPAVVVKKLHANASSEAVLKEVVRLEAALKVTQQTLDETRAKEAAATADLGKVVGCGAPARSGQGICCTIGQDLAGVLTLCFFCFFNRPWIASPKRRPTWSKPRSVQFP